MSPTGSFLRSSMYSAEGAWLGSSEMARRVRAFNWSETPLGPIDAWPRPLTCTVALCLRSPFRMALYWGPDLICIYNDAEREMLPELHPRALGMPARELLHGCWEVVGPQLAAVTERGEATWAEDQPLMVERRGRNEVSYFTYSYSPILDDVGRVGGVLVVAHETTARVLAERRLNATHDLAAQSLDAATVQDACNRCARALSESEDVMLGAVYVLDDREGRATCVAAQPAAQALPEPPPSVELADTADEVSTLFAELATARSGGRLVPLSLVMPARANGRGAPEMAFVAPIASGTRDRLQGFLVVGVRDDLQFDRGYAEFLDLAAMVVGRSIAAAHNREAEQRRAGAGRNGRSAALLGAEAEAGAEGDRLRLLVVEDSADMCEYLRRLLAPEFSIQLARDGEEARRLVDSDPPSLVISDVMMPDTDGFTLIRQLRSAPRTRCLPVILLSADADANGTQHALELGADDYIIKPFVGNELLARIRATLENARRRTDAAAAQARVQEHGRHESELRALLNDLRAAQRRVVAAGDAERRRIERDLHDGAQQRLMAVRLELALLEEQLQQEPHAAARQLALLRRELDEALEELRELAHGLSPPLLASDGLEAALTAVGRRSPLPVRVDARGMVRAPRSIESTAYFCCIEALQNAVKHAGPAARVTIKLAMRNHCLVFTVEDDGVGFDPDVVAPGQGLINLRDRLSGLGGSAQIRSAPGAGTSVSGEIPLS